MAMNELTVDVGVRITVSDETAERCLVILAMWQDDHKDSHIVGERLPDGRTVFKIKRIKEADNV
ncbi:MAG: hypothetical protein IIV27_03420 [Clostridia bacterium]|jgi:hypothetical protein|nr:hypothetical protein [Clostridia bacterium]